MKQQGEGGTMKPPILSERQFEDWCKAHQKQVWDRFEAQRDADVAYYEPLIEQAKAEVAREIQKGIIESYPGVRWLYNQPKWQAFWDKYTGGKK